MDDRFIKKIIPFRNTARDSLLAILAGGGIAVLTIPIVINLQSAHSLPSFFFYIPFYVLIPIWIIFLSLGAALELFVAHILSEIYLPWLYQVAKYGLIGLANSFLTASIVNILIYSTGIERGFLVDGFFIFAFSITVTHSFVWNKYWIFPSSQRRTLTEYYRFYAVTTVVLSCVTVLFHILVNQVGPLLPLHARLWVNIVLVLLTVVSFLGNYFGYKLFVFKT